MGPILPEHNYSKNGRGQDERDAAPAGSEVDLELGMQEMQSREAKDDASEGDMYPDFIRSSVSQKACSANLRADGDDNSDVEAASGDCHVPVSCRVCLSSECDADPNLPLAKLHLPLGCGCNCIMCIQSCLSFSGGEKEASSTEQPRPSPPTEANCPPSTEEKVVAPVSSDKPVVINMSCLPCCKEARPEQQAMVRLGCDCRGEMAYAHYCCALRWFASRDDNLCEICDKEVTALHKDDILLLRRVSQASKDYERVGQILARPYEEARLAAEAADAEEELGRPVWLWTLEILCLTLSTVLMGLPFSRFLSVVATSVVVGLDYVIGFSLALIVLLCLRVLEWKVIKVGPIRFWLGVLIFCHVFFLCWIIASHFIG